jgi:phospholipase C
MTRAGRVRHAVAVAAALVATLVVPLAGPNPARADPSTLARTPVRHFIFLMQGDRTFDNYFGRYPGADGIPAGVCLARVSGRPQSGCVKPFPLHGEVPAALAPGQAVIQAQFDNGRMDAFVSAFTRQGRDGTTAMGYYDERDIGYYWGLAQRYVLFDRFFSSAPYGIRLNRSYWVSAAPPPGGERIPAGGYGNQPTIFDRLQSAGVSWKFYVEDYHPGETFRAVSPTEPAAQATRVPLLTYARFVDDPALRSHVVDIDEYYQDLAQGTLPAVAYIASANASERSARSMPAGQRLVRGLLTQLMLSQYWQSSAFLWSYDGSGGWYDHVPPPRVGPEQWGARVPALLVSAYARVGQVDHDTLDYTSALKFVEDNWGVPALTSRDASAHSIASAFDFAAGPRPAVLPPRAGPAVTTGASAAAGPRRSGVGAIYGLYGAALAVGVGMWAAALVSTRIRRRRLAALRASFGRTDPVSEVVAS